MFQQVCLAIESFGSFTPEEQEALSKEFQHRIIDKGQFILSSGEVCQSIWFVNKGALRHYRDLDGFSEVTINLFHEDHWVLDHHSFTAQKPSKNYIQAVEECELLEISIHALHQLIETSPSFFKLGKILEIPRNEPELHTKKPENRYLELMENSPELIQRFPLKYIASYLGMTPETLSRVRAKVKF